MSATQSNLARLKQAYVNWNATKGGNFDEMRALMADRFRLMSIDETAPGLRFARDAVTREQAIGYLSGIFNDWEMVEYRPETYVAEGDRIAMFGLCEYRNKATGKHARCRIACLWRFEGDEAVEMTEIFDTAVAVAAATA